MLEVQEAPNRPADKVCSTASRRKPRTVDVGAIERLDRDGCIERWWQVLGVAPPKYTSLELMRKVIAYEVQVKAFGGHSNAVQRALKASLKPVRSEVEADSSADANADTNFDARAPTGSASVLCAEEGVAGGLAPNSHQAIRLDNITSDACDQAGMTGRARMEPSAIAQARGKADANTDASTVTKSTRTAKSTKPSVLSVRAGTHLVREWNGRTYQVEALERGFRLDGKTYRSLSAIAKKITGAHWSGPRFFGLES